MTQSLYRLGPLSRALRRALNVAAPRGRTVVTIAGGDLAGARMRLDLQEEKDLWLGTYEPQLQAAIRDHVTRGSTAFDLGAHIGYATLLLARACGPGGTVVAFEPLPDNLHRLRENLRWNDLGAGVRVVPMAVGERTATERFHVQASPSTGRLAGSRVDEPPPRGAIEVETIDLDAFVYVRGGPLPNVIKMDIEGGESVAVRGMRRVLAEARPMLLLEVHGAAAGTVLRAELARAGYSLHHMRSGYPRVQEREKIRGKAYLVARPPGDRP